jgi:hypothetical protein
LPGIDNDFIAQIAAAKGPRHFFYLIAAAKGPRYFLFKSDCRCKRTKIALLSNPAPVFDKH